MARQLGFIDRVTETQIIGWAADLDHAPAPARLAVRLDGAVVDSVVCDRRRNDLEAAGLPSTDVGFVYDIPRACHDGALHRVSFRFYNGVAVPFTNNRGQSIEEWHFTSTTPSSYEGFVDGLTEGNSVSGWVVRIDPGTNARQGGVRVTVSVDGRKTAEVVADRFRPDVASVHRCDPWCGFSWQAPPEYRTGRRHRITLRVAGDTQDLPNSPFDLVLLPQDATATLTELLSTATTLAAEAWQLKQRMRRLLRPDERALADYPRWAAGYFRQLAARADVMWADGDGAKLVSVLCPVFRPHLAHFIAAVESVQAQTYGNWELILADDASKDAALDRWIEDCMRADRRIRKVTRRRQGGIGAATNSALAAAKGDFVTFLDHDDMLAPQALACMVHAAAVTGARLLYSDEDKIDDFGNHSDPHFKPDWNYRLLLANNYVCHLTMMERTLATALGGLSTRHDGAQDHDLMLRAAEILAPEEICHVPEILYHWRKSAGSTALDGGAKAYTVSAGISAIEQHLARAGHAGSVSQVTPLNAYRIAWRMAVEASVTIIIPYRDQIETTERCLRAVLSLTAYRNYRIVLVDNWSVTEAARRFAADAANIENVRVLRVAEAFNFSRLNNLAAREAPADYFMFMNNDLFVTDRGWLSTLVAEAQVGRRVGAVGGKFLYPDGTVQHAGVVLGVGGIADHAHRGLRRDDPGYMARAILPQDVSAVTAAGMLCNASAFRDVGGFDEDDLAVAFNDVDLCLKLRRAGWRVVFTPAFLAEHHESVSRGDDMAEPHRVRFAQENIAMQARWGEVLARDPHYNINFSRHDGIFRLLAREREEGASGLY